MTAFYQFRCPAGRPHLGVVYEPRALLLVVSWAVWLREWEADRLRDGCTDLRRLPAGVGRKRWRKLQRGQRP